MARKNQTQQQPPDAPEHHAAGTLRFRALRPCNVDGMAFETGEIVVGAERLATVKQMVLSCKVEPVVADGAGGWKHPPYRVLRKVPGHAHNAVLVDVTALGGWERYRAARFIGAVVDWAFAGQYQDDAEAA